MKSEKSNEKIRYYFVIGFLVAILFMFITTRIIDFLFRIGEQKAIVRTFFKPSDILSFVGIVLSITATITLAWIVWRQNEKLREINTNLQKQNMRISENALINSSYNFMSIPLLQIESYNVGRLASPWLDIPQITLNRINAATGGGNGSPYDIKITFFGEAFSNAPICDFELEEFKLSFESSVGRRVIPYIFKMDSKYTGMTFQTSKDHEEASGSLENSYSFTIRCHIPFYFDDQLLESPHVKNIEVEMTASYVNLLRVTTKLSHKLCLTKDETQNYFNADDNIRFIRLGLKEAELQREGEK